MPPSSKLPRVPSNDRANPTNSNKEVEVSKSLPGHTDHINEMDKNELASGIVGNHVLRHRVENVHDHVIDHGETAYSKTADDHVNEADLEESGNVLDNQGDHDNSEATSRTVEDDESDNQVDPDSSLDTASSRNERVLYYYTIEDISDRLQGCVYCLFPKVFDQRYPPYNPYEWVNFLKDTVLFQVKHNFQLPARDTAFWAARSICIDEHEELHGKYIIKHSLLWDDRDSRAHCFERAQSNRFALMMLGAFQQSILIHKRRKERNQGCANDMHRQMYSESLSLKTARSLFDQARWFICEGKTDPKSTHRYIWEYDFHALPTEKQTWTDHLYAWFHYTYEVTGGQTLFAGLDCDEHGQLSNLVLFTKGKPPHYDESAGMKARIDRAFLHFREQHVCNKICEHLGLRKLKTFQGRGAGDWLEILYLNSP
ncbi:uncharacterized protein MELLADRAFT_59669 [Melampsora larici-populina 98AG31]|uniref:Alpha-type protein kinase domain-containing protein n=1 Tax=Melampsora larici-populina (strain 98AG31 / pathotype 3-4-7) TaxID=747676 RepID=F4R8E4_MELLP|nr:uncharacterized protein MELLADRAFT_59669 [Melampsora larici-populina 98AG31]EGG11620.1 hypothetical protein MELLADRAFT_59669 [Melampsora larici-populina 98AG31]